MKTFQEIDAVRAFNAIDSILIEEAFRDAKQDGQITKARTSILGVYNRGESSDYADYSDDELDQMYGTRSDPSKPAKAYIPTVEPSEAGYPGLGAPLN